MAEGILGGKGKWEGCGTIGLMNAGNGVVILKKFLFMNLIEVFLIIWVGSYMPFS